MLAEKWAKETMPFILYYYFYSINCLQYVNNLYNLKKVQLAENLIQKIFGILKTNFIQGMVQYVDLIFVWLSQTFNDWKLILYQKQMLNHENDERFGTLTWLVVRTNVNINF